MWLEYTPLTQQYTPLYMWLKYTPLTQQYTCLWSLLQGVHCATAGEYITDSGVCMPYMTPSSTFDLPMHYSQIIELLRKVTDLNEEVPQ